ncbi:nicotinamide-nucleotide amidohydrolase family protein [Nocardioides campestrisoli]|uniref:nicotinamide-nucleotide amidohydrolase family protein n=1 Tax=Nocardioides campestrisoli TaxID=2736757 RepID=UPI00163D74F5|nr:nicotinamide-nucleotide amidohydrolase family protein [Nocardioides campestrisoli]
MAEDFSQYVNQIAELAAEHGLAIGAAESLTGGAITSALAQGEGAADWCRGGVVAYMPAVKFDLLGVEPGPLISDACAAQMAAGAAKALEADFVVSTTGAGGPGEEEGHPAGTAVIGMWARGEQSTDWVKAEGDPAEVVESVRNMALERLLQAIRVAEQKA